MLWLVLHDEHSAFDIAAAQISSLKSHQITSAIAKTAFFVVVSKKEFTLYLDFTWKSVLLQSQFTLFDTDTFWMRVNINQGLSAPLVSVHHITGPVMFKLFSR